MGNYYCLMAGLPDITLENTKQEVSMPDLREELEAVLSEKDKKVLYYFFLQKDCTNLVRLLKNPKAEIDDYGKGNELQCPPLSCLYEHLCS